MTEKTPTSTNAEPTAEERTSAEDDALQVFALFVTGTLTFSWGLWILPLLGIVPSSSMGVLARVGGFGPFVGALVALTAEGRSIRMWLRSNIRIQIPARWYASALVLPPLLVVAAGVVHVALFGARLELDAINPLWVYPVAVVVVFLIGGGQEELGWRAFALPALQTRYSAVTASLGVGAVWALWHLPLFFIPGSPQQQLPVGPYVAAVLAASVVLTWLYNSSESVLIPMLFHGGLNPIAAYFPTGGTEAIGTVTGYGSYALVLFGTVVVLLAVYDPRDLANGGRITMGDILPSEGDTDRGPQI
ncbi:CPBP family intramembrane metalloprotease [Halobellus sp. Atlit-31R]|nr:CPBP family intramembrane metalloprotease [Halobellus sp. Atlit-31R]